MSFEEEKLGEAQKVLQETEKRCEVGDGFVKSFKRKFTKKKKTVCWNVIIKGYASHCEKSVQSTVKTFVVDENDVL